MARFITTPERVGMIKGRQEGIQVGLQQGLEQHQASFLITEVGIEDGADT